MPGEWGEEAVFYHHVGVDCEAVKAAAQANYQGRKLRGGSTISQQTAKNAFLWPGRSYVRKGLEAYFTGLIEIFWGKPRIMEVYLNIVEMGPGIYVMPAATKHFFGPNVDRLRPQPAAWLIPIPPHTLQPPLAKLPTSARSSVPTSANAG